MGAVRIQAAEHLVMQRALFVVLGAPLHPEQALDHRIQLAGSSPCSLSPIGVSMSGRGGFFVPASKLRRGRRAEKRIRASGTRQDGDRRCQEEFGAHSRGKWYRFGHVTTVDHGRRWNQLFTKVDITYQLGYF